jgi:NAD+ synthase (glutamine-hydrolysing)
MAFGIEIGEDLFNVNSPGENLALCGATMLFNLTASNDLIGRYEYRKELLKVTSNRLVSAYVYCSCGLNESTTDLVYSGYAGIYEKGKLLVENERFNFETNQIMQDVDIQRLVNNRNNELFGCADKKVRYVDVFIKEIDLERGVKIATIPGLFEEL